MLRPELQREKRKGPGSRFCGPRLVNNPTVSSVLISLGSPADYLSPVALRPTLTNGLPLSGCYSVYGSLCVILYVSIILSIARLRIPILCRAPAAVQLAAGIEAVRRPSVP